MGVGKRIKKVWGELVQYRPSNDSVFLRPRGVDMVGWGAWPIFVTWKPNERDVTDIEKPCLFMYQPMFVHAFSTWWCHMLMSSLFYSSLNITPNFLIKVITSGVQLKRGVRNNGNMLFRSF